jgi:molybdopterin converting factor small subunit
MAVRVYLAGYLRPYAEGLTEVCLEEAPVTVRGVLEELARRYPGVTDRVLTEQGALRPHVNLFVGNESVRFASGLQTLVADGSEIAILPAVSGGCGT